ncbi:serine protease [Candidatus Binatia bacterium]|nr:serine protease [Candidatus Binatia bacterium]
MPSNSISCRPFAVAALIGLVAASAALPPGARADLAAPGAIVSSDGRTFPRVTLPLLESPPFEGTGVLPEGARAAKVAPPNLDARPAGGAGIESIIDTDERHQVSDTTLFPFRAIVSLEIASVNGNFICSGFFIDADTVATAGHCVYGSGLGGWATSITAYPGRNGAAAPYGSATSVAMFAPDEWVDSEDEHFDYGAIKLDTALGETVGWLGYGVKVDDAMIKRNIRIFGYPADKPAGTMWGTKRSIKAVEPEKIYYKIDTFGGQSGSPVYGKVSNACQTCAFGIHAYGTGGGLYPASNSGTRVTSDVFANLAFWATQ